MTEEEIKQYMALDTTRQWATQVSLMLNGPLVMLVFREQLIASTDNPEDKPVEIVKNVASILLPMPTVQELAVIIQNILGEPGTIPPSIATAMAAQQQAAETKK